MYKKSPSNSRDSKKSNSSFGKKDDSRGSSYSKKTYKSDGGAGDDSDRPRKPYSGRTTGTGSSSSGPRKDGPYSKPGRTGAPRDNDRGTGKPSFRDGGRPASGDRAGRPDSRPFRERTDRGENESGPRKEYTKPYNKESRDGDQDKRPYSGRLGRPAETEGDRKEELSDYRDKLKLEYDLIEEIFHLEANDRNW